LTYCGDGRCAWEAIYSSSSPSSKSSSAVSTLCTSSLVQMAGIALELGTWSGVCNFQFSKGLLCKRAEMYYSLTV